MLLQVTTGTAARHAARLLRSTSAVAVLFECHVQCPPSTAALFDSAATITVVLLLVLKLAYVIIVNPDAGTLTVPVIDFQYMRQRAGVGPTGDILDIISGWAPEEQQRAHQAIQEVEDQALRDMQVTTVMDTRR